MLKAFGRAVAGVLLLIAFAPVVADAQVAVSRMRSGFAQASYPPAPPIVFYTVPADSYLVITDINWFNVYLALVVMPPSGTSYNALWTSPFFFDASTTSGTKVGFIPQTHLVTGVVFRPGTRAAGLGSVSNNYSNGFYWSGYLVPVSAAVGVEVPGDLSPTIQLGAIPNPTMGSSQVQFSLPMTGRVVIAVFDVQGRQVKTLFSGTMRAGKHTLEWDGRDDGGQPVTSGVYFARLDGASGAKTTKMIHVR